MYLGSSLYVCWEELGRPEFNSLQISRFQIEPKTRLAIVDFGIRLQRIHQNLVEPSNGFNYSKEFYDDIDKDYISKAICWPILFACSIKVREPNAVFKPEYIIPQLILEWVTTERGYEGIRYFSLVLPNYRLDDELFFNYVFPVRTRPSKGLCSYLVNLFKMTEPISWGLARSMYLSSESNYEGNFSNNFNIIDSLSCKYSTTEFGRVQNIVDDLPLSYIGN